MKTRMISITAIALFAALAISIQPAKAKVVYTPIHLVLTVNRQSLALDLNHDKATDFTIQEVFQDKFCGLGIPLPALMGYATIAPTPGNGVVVSGLNFAALLPSGVPIDSSGRFYQAQAVFGQFFICGSGYYHAAGYLGLEFQISGQTHYGWAQVSVDARLYNAMHWMRTTLTGFAYETIPGQAINTGQTSGPAGLAAPEQAKQELDQTNFKFVDMGTRGVHNSRLPSAISFESTAKSLSDAGTVAVEAETSTPDPFAPMCFSPDCLVTRASKRRTVFQPNPAPFRVSMA